jgi:hypothetical protein
MFETTAGRPAAFRDWFSRCSVVETTFYPIAHRQDRRSCRSASARSPRSQHADKPCPTSRHLVTQQTKPSVGVSRAEPTTIHSYWWDRKCSHLEVGVNFQYIVGDLVTTAASRCVEATEASAPAPRPEGRSRRVDPLKRGANVVQRVTGVHDAVDPRDRWVG